MTTTSTPDSSDNTLDRPPFAHGRHSEGQYYTELIRIATGLFVGLLALMTFLLTVGFPRPHAFFAWALYASIITLGLNLIAYVLGNFFHAQCRSRHLAIKTAQDEGKDLVALKGDWERDRNRLKVTRLAQQILFVVAVVAITCLALATANFFFAIPPTTSPAAAPQ